ncbi:hypothetical protein AC578_6944 [Pseudocercospora eumusae]|uniref:Uncharacterized protein n=1 Tax=Pseudocercospora eumusae TaxID=321146 RepID=A0A139H9B0_9PEZI|nr:hypothetical protein AC578_6944 [Pseudocercospora eumusae]
MAAVAVSRKPLPGQGQRPAPAQYNNVNGMNNQYNHTRARTNSSTALGLQNDSGQRQPSISPAYSMTQSQSQYPQPGQTRRTLSNATGSSTSSQNSNLQRAPTNMTNGVRRSTSSRSQSSLSPTSYVALMRKQKATVWCDRAQHEDPRILAAQRQAKMRAAAEVAGGHNYTSTARTSTSSSGVVGGVRSKIRHHGAPKASAYNATLKPGAGVPMRLSASEVDDGNNSDDDTGARYHVRTGSGRSSLGSGRRGHSFHASALNNSYSNGNTPPGVSPVDSMGDPIEEETPMPRNDGADPDYFGKPSGGSSEEEQFGQVGGLPSRKITVEEQIQQQKSNADDLRRRGSVDERTMTMSGPRLFVANPDLSD